MKIDPLDAHILGILREDARRSYREIADLVGSTQPTVSARIKALEDIGLIRGYRVELDLTMTGGPLVQIRIHVRPSDARAAADQLANAAYAEEVLLLTGGDVHARFRLRPPQFTTSALHDVVADLPGVLTYDIQEILASPTPTAMDHLPEQVDVPCHQCGGPIHGAPTRKALGGRTHVFCCRGCLGTFQERYEKTAASARAERRRR